MLRVSPNFYMKGIYKLIIIIHLDGHKFITLALRRSRACSTWATASSQAWHHSKLACTSLHVWFECEHYNIVSVNGSL